MDISIFSAVTYNQFKKQLEDLTNNITDIIIVTITNIKDTLFSAKVKRPLADRLRPQKLTEVVGQDHIIGEDAPLGRMISSGKVTSFILWGPPGCGKTTIARLIAENTNLRTKNKTDAQMIRDIKKWIEEEVQCCSDQ